MVFCSAYDPPIPPHAPQGAVIYRLGPAFNRWLFTRIKPRLRRLVAPVDALRAELGLPPGANPIFEGQHSPTLTLALFSPLFGPPQADWPASAHAVGFPFYDRLERGK